MTMIMIYDNNNGMIYGNERHLTTPSQSSSTQNFKYFQVDLRFLSVLLL